MRIAVTGATGFLGRHIVSVLKDCHDIVCISRSGDAPDGCTGKKIDVVHGRGLKAAFAKADVVIHAAGLVSHQLERAADTWAVHVTGTQNVLDAAKASKVSRVVYLSTSGTMAVSSDSESHATERSPTPEALISRWPYYRSKLYAEQLALGFDGPDVISLNPSLLLGPGDVPGGTSTHAVSVFLDQGVPVAPPGGISFVDVRDVAGAVEQALTRGRAGERYLLAGANMRFLDFYARLARITGRDEPLLAMPRMTQKMLQWFPTWGREKGISAGVGPVISREDLELSSHYWYADSSKANEAFDWVARDPIVTLEETVFDILERKNQAYARYR
jgi:dihydroflavonol-4-reductase